MVWFANYEAGGERRGYRKKQRQFVGDLFLVFVFCRRRVGEEKKEVAGRGASQKTKFSTWAT